MEETDTQGPIRTHSRQATDGYLLSKTFDTKFQQTIMALRRRELAGSFNVAKATVEIMKVVISAVRWTNAKEILEEVKKNGLILAQAQPLELAIGNIVRRVMFLIREEYLNFSRAAQPGESSEFQELNSAPALYKMLSNDEAEDYSKNYDIKSNVLTAIGDLTNEISDSYSHISDKQSTQHIHNGETIMTFGKSQTVVEFLKAAARKRKFEVIVAESAPLFAGQEMALSLSKAGIETTVIPDSAIFAMMARVNKVIVGTHVVMANGGLLSWAGTHGLALAAKHHEVPFVICTGLYKLCPVYPTYDQDRLNDLNSPCKLLRFDEAADVDVQNPMYDYIQPELVSLFITNYGGHNPSYIYRLLQEYYHPADYVLE
eukprot:TRINITY_DN4838_c0_g1_i1.p1 TRINITY_DN4838_c0_g1~~TRINITY_DN4838_c0_g1_i1.p1  ORF type:complete len:373 (-),score=77.84 TRINITY_DN4838_c0_g1_i1:103-1221(-)